MINKNIKFYYNGKEVKGDALSEATGTCGEYIASLGRSTCAVVMASKEDKNFIGLKIKGAMAFAGTYDCSTEIETVYITLYKNADSNELNYFKVKDTEGVLYDVKRYNYFDSDIVKLV